MASSRAYRPASTGCGAARRPRQLPAGGETAGRRRLEAWFDDGLARYGELADDLAADATSRLSPYLHFGCVSAGEVVARALEREGAEPFVRQLCWRDFNHQLLAARPELAREDMRPRSAAWRDDDEALRGLAGGPHGLSARRCGHATADGRGLHAQPRAARRRLVPDEAPRDRLAPGRGALLRAARRRRRRQQHGQLAVGRRHRRRHAPEPKAEPERQAERFDPDAVYVRRYVPELGTPEYPLPIAVAA